MATFWHGFLNIIYFYPRNFSAVGEVKPGFKIMRPTKILGSDFADRLMFRLCSLCSDSADLCSDFADLCSDFAELCSDLR